jgi:hypothetical protein
MSKSSPVHTLVVPWRKVCAALPAVALIGGGIALNAQAAPAHPIKSAAAWKDSPVIVVPDRAVTIPAVPAQISAGPAAVAPGTRALVLPAGTVPGSSTPVALDRAGIPIRALAGYRRAASLIDPADPGCHIDWALLAAIGRVESDHGRFGGNQLDAAGVARPGIIGIALDGTNGTARITDTDSGLMDGDTVYDRAVGPMQFLPGTWRVVGTDADGDGVKNPQDIADAATAAAIYLCSGHADLSQPAGLNAAIMRYNASDSYVRTVIAIADAYRHGVSALPASALPATDLRQASPGRSTSAPARAAARPTPAQPAPSRPGSTPAIMQRPTLTAPDVGPTLTAPDVGPTPVPSTSTAAPTSTATAPTATAPGQPDPCLPLPGTTTPAANAVPAATVTATNIPAPAVPCPMPTSTTSPLSPTTAP